MTLFQILTALSPLLCWLGIALPVTVSVMCGPIWKMQLERHDETAMQLAKF